MRVYAVHLTYNEEFQVIRVVLRSFFIETFEHVKFVQKMVTLFGNEKCEISPRWSEENKSFLMVQTIYEIVNFMKY